MGRLRRFGVGCQLAALVGSAGLRAFVSRPLVAVVAGGMVLLRTLLRSRGFRENSRGIPDALLVIIMPLERP